MSAVTPAEHIALIRDLMALADTTAEQHGPDTRAAGTAGMAAFHQLRMVRGMDRAAADALYLEIRRRAVPEPHAAPRPKRAAKRQKATR